MNSSICPVACEGYPLIAKALCRAANVEDPLALALVDIIFGSAKEGHLCLNQDEILSSAFFDSFSKEKKEVILKWLSSGTKTLPSPLFSYLEKSTQTLKTPIGFFNGHFYLQKNWVLESIFVSEIAKFLHKENVALPILDLQEHLNEEQKEAVYYGLTAPFLMITGGPGTGKTYVAKEILKALHMRGNKEKVLVCAPTGKAVANIKKSLSGSLNADHITFSTLHGALKIKNFEESSRSIFFLPFDLVIVDECSMIDMKVFIKLFQSLHRKSRLILLGDPHQLPPVDVGTAFYDMSKISGLKKIHLSRCIRIESKDILGLAFSVMQADCEIEKRAEIEPLQNFSLEFFAPLAKSIACSSFDFATIEKAFAEHKILCSHNVGPYGTERMNQAILDFILKNSEDSKKLFLPIILQRSYQKYDLMNGEQGILIKHPKDPKEDVLLFETKEGIQKIKAHFISDYALSFAISIHKSQGSEYNHVYIVCADESEMISQELLYTSITRARKSVRLFASPPTLKKALQKTSMKCSQIVSRLQ